MIPKNMAPRMNSRAVTLNLMIHGDGSRIVVGDDDVAVRVASVLLLCIEQRIITSGLNPKAEEDRFESGNALEF